MVVGGSWWWLVVMVVFLVVLVFYNMVGENKTYKNYISFNSISQSIFFLFFSKHNT